MLFEIGVFIALEAVLLAAVAILREPRLLIPCVVLGLPFEYVSTQAVSSLGESGTGGIIRTLLNPGKAAMLATIIVAVWQARHDPRRLVPNSAMIVPLSLLMFVVVAGVAWSDSLRPSNGVLIMPMYVAFVWVAPAFIRNRQDLERIAIAFFIAAAMLSVVALAQRILGVFQWRSILIQSDDYSYRSNAFFADPNNLARFLAITVALAAGYLLTTGPRRLTVYVAAPALAISLPAIIVTASRSGWLGLLLASFLVVMFSPIRRYTKLRLSSVAFGGLTLLLILVFVQGGANAERVKSLTSGVELLGQRAFLIRGGWEMWKDNPLVGVGSGNYQHTLVLSYLWTLPWWAQTTLSHTSIISILAELGLVGLAAFLFFAVRLAITCRATYLASDTRYNRLLAGWCAAAFVEILFQSQSEGRLFEEPFLYLLVAILVALELGAATRGHDPCVVPAEERVPETAGRRTPAESPARTPPPLAPQPLPPGAGG